MISSLSHFCSNSREICGQKSDIKGDSIFIQPRQHGIKRLPKQSRYPFGSITNSLLTTRTTGGILCKRQRDHHPHLCQRWVLRSLALPATLMWRLTGSIPSPSALTPPRSVCALAPHVARHGSLCAVGPGWIQVTIPTRQFLSSSQNCCENPLTGRQQYAILPLPTQESANNASDARAH